MPRRGKTVPTLAGRPLVGSMTELQADPMATCLRARDEHGGVVRIVAGPPGMRSEFYGVFSAAGTQQVLATDAVNFRKDNQVYAELRASIGNGLLTSQDETYLRQRRMVQPLFTHRQIDTYAHVMHDEVKRITGTWSGVVDVADASTRLALRVVVRILFGADSEVAQEVIERCLPPLADYTVRRGFAPRTLPRSWPTPSNRRAAAMQADLHQVCDRIIAARRTGRGPNDNDLLGLLAAPDGTDRAPASEEVRDQVLVFLVAGHETTATSIAFALHLLAKHPEAQSKARAEAAALGDHVPTGSDLTSLPYLVRVLKETMRLYPAAPLLGRRAVADAVVDGHAIPARADLLLSPWVTHRDPTYWPEPEQFDPDRFLPEREAERPRYAWIPFGGGPRACIGQHFSMVESVLTLAIVLRAFELDAIDEDIPLGYGITTQIVGPARCRLRPL